MFYDMYQQLCQQKKVSPSRAAEDIGLSRSTVVKWKTGALPNGTTLQKMAAYFGVSADVLLHGRPKPSPDELVFDDFTYALHNEARELTEENKQKLLELARFFKQEQEKKGL